MDTVTQFALGAAVGTAVLGRTMGVRKAALAGGLLGTLPDLDVYWPYENAIDSFVLHRSVTHSLLIHAAITPLIAEGFLLLFRSLREFRIRTYLAVFLCLSTHALLDALTIYGTQLFWPLSREPVGLGSIFIIDPLYTLPLLVVTLWAVFFNRWTARFATTLKVALVFSTLYLGWAAIAQHLAQSRAEDLLAKAGIRAERLFATPTPFNTEFWRIVALDGPRYLNLYIPLLGDEDTVTVYEHPRLPPSADCLERNRFVKTLDAFTNGFYRFETKGDALVMADLRMGLTPRYVFQFVVAEHGTARRQSRLPRRIPSARSSPGDMDWLLAGIMGYSATRPAEADARIHLNALKRVSAGAATVSAC